MTDRPTVTLHKRQIGFPVSEELLEDNERWQRAINDGLSQLVDRLRDSDLTSPMPMLPVKLKTRRTRLREWVALRLWNLALRLDPELEPADW